VRLAIPAMCALEKGEKHMSTTPKTKASTLALLQALIAGTQKHLASGSFSLVGTSYTAASLVPILQGLANAITAVNAAQANAKDTVAAMHGIEATVVPLIGAYQRFIHASFASVTQTLADFGLTPPKARAPLTVEQKAAAKAKAEATRLARGTTSKKQKLAVTGNVTGVTVTPITAPTAAPPAPPASPAPPVTPASPASPSAQPASATPSAPVTGTATK
jgi:hypothetical protein